MNPGGTTLDKEVREGLLKQHGGSQTAVFRALKPPFSYSTNYRAITGGKVGEEVRGWFHSRFYLSTARVYTNEQIKEALEIALSSMRQLTRRKVSMEDFKREIALMMKDEAA